MKKHIILLLLVLFSVPLLAEVIQVGNGTTADYYIPINFWWKNGLSESIYFADEIAAGGINGGAITGEITEMTYSYYFRQNLSDLPFNIWMGETTLDALPETWISAGLLTQVFSGNLSFTTGEGELQIIFDEPYIYNGDNLVVMVERVMDTEYYENDNDFYYEDTPEHEGRSLSKASDTIDYDPYFPPASPSMRSWVPNTQFVIDVDGVGSLNGYVYDSTTNEGIEGVNVEMTPQGRFTALTDANGYYEFSGLFAGDYEVYVNIFGYYDETVMVTLLEDETIQQDFNLDPFENADITGRVVGSDNPTVGIANAELSLDGIENYDTVSDNDGYFTFSGAYSNAVYQLIIVTEGYETYVGEVNLGTANLDLGDVIVNEITFPVDDVIAEANAEDSEVNLIWDAPIFSTNEFFDFEDGNGEFTADMGWEWGIDSGTGNATHIWGTDLGTNYPNYANYQLVTPEFHIYGNDILLTFSHYYDIEAGWDGGNVKISVDGGMTWELINPIGGYPDEAHSSCAGIPEEPCYAGNSYYWETAIFELAAYADEDVMFKFHFGSDAATEETGWFIDDVALYLAGRGSLTQTHENLVPIALSPRNLSRSLDGYSIYRLAYGEENDETNWVEVATEITETTYTDLTWAEVDNGLWRYAVKAEYTNGLLSEPEISNWLGKQMYSDVTVNVTTNDGDLPAGAEVVMYGTMPDPDGNFPEYYAIADNDGICTIDHVWKSTYFMEVNLLNYEIWGEIVEIDENIESFDVMVNEFTSYPIDVQASINTSGDADLIWHNPIVTSYVYWDFENHDGDFVSTAGWEWGTDATAGAHSGTKVWGTDLNDNYINDADYQLITPDIHIESDEVQLTFWYWCDSAPYFDGFNVEIQYTSSSWWQLLYPLEGYNSSASGLDGEECFAGNDQVWSMATFDLSAYDGNDVRLRFHFGSNSSTTFLGVMIDDVFVGTPAERAIQMSSNTPRDLESYSIYRGLNGDEENFEDWDVIAEGIADTTYEDITWSQIIDPDIYKYCVRAEYSSSILSAPSFSNWLEANSVANVTVNLSTNDGGIPAGAYVELRAIEPNPGGEYYEYSGIADDMGTTILSGVYYGDYELTAELDGYAGYEGNLEVDQDMTVEVMISELAFPAYDVFVEEDDNQFAQINWHSPSTCMEMIWDFEDDDGEFISNDPTGWSWGEDATIGAHSGDNAWVTAINTNYEDEIDFQLISPEVTIQTDETQLTFYHYMDSEYNYDGGNVKITIDGGYSWSLITPQGGYPNNYVGGPGYTGGPNWTPTGWVLAVFDLTYYVGYDAMFKWHFVSDEYQNSLGWAIDDVRIGENLTRINPLARNSQQRETRDFEGYSIYRGLLGDEANVDNWDLIVENIIDTSYTDESWASVTSPGVYCYAVKAEYSNGVLADAAFSNWMANNMYAEVTINMTTNIGDSPEGALVYLESTAPDPYGNYQNYEGIADENGLCIINDVWVNNYDIVIELDNFMTYEDNIDIDGDMEIDIIIGEFTNPPCNVIVEESHAGNAYIVWHSPTGSSWNFEQYDGEFISNDPAGWSWGEDEAMGAHSGVNAWVTAINSNYENNTDLQLISPEVTIQTEETQLTFYHYMDSENSYDGGNVKISIDGGNSWELITPEGGYPGNYVGGPGYTGGPSGWVMAVFDLSDYERADAIFKWHFVSDALENEYYGWAIDDVKIGEPDDDRDEISLFGDMKHALGKASDAPVSEDRMWIGYNIYRGLENDMENFENWEIIAEAYVDTTMEDETWSQINSAGIYMYCVRSLYTNGILSEPAFSNSLAFIADVTVSITVTANSGDPTDGAYVELINQDGNPQHIYTGTVTGGMVYWSEVFRGTYDLTIELYGHVTYEQSDVSIYVATTLNVELEESICAPADPAVNNETGLFTWSVPEPEDNLEYKSINNAINAGNLAMASEQEIPETLTRSVDYYIVYLDGTLIDQTTQMFFEFDTVEGWSYGEEYTAGVSAHYTSNNESILAETDFTCLFIDPVNGNDIPLVTALTGNYPNPFNPSTTINFAVSQEDSPVKISIYNIKGQLVQNLIDKNYPAGKHQIVWSTEALPSGVYLCKANIAGKTFKQKMLLTK